MCFGVLVSEACAHPHEGVLHSDTFPTAQTVHHVEIM
jgi:hypothetical protein